MHERLPHQNKWYATRVNEVMQECVDAVSANGRSRFMPSWTAGAFVTSPLATDNRPERMSVAAAQTMSKYYKVPNDAKPLAMCAHTGHESQIRRSVTEGFPTMYDNE